MGDQSAWYLELRRQAEVITGEEAARFWPAPDGEKPYYNFRLEHILQVDRDARRIMAVEKGDEESLMAAVWIHDRFQPQFQGAQHGEKAAKWARQNLMALGFPAYKIAEVCQAVELHTRRTMDIPSEARTARLLWDADHLARYGPVGLINFLMCHLARDFLEGLGDNSAFPQERLTIRDLAPLLLERRPALYRSDWFYFDESRRLAKQRIAVQRAFFDVLEDQLW
jgi:HD superfamily phosphodiesterase